MRHKGNSPEGSARGFRPSLSVAITLWPLGGDRWEQGRGWQSIKAVRIWVLGAWVQPLNCWTNQVKSYPILGLSLSIWVEVFCYLQLITFFLIKIWLTYNIVLASGVQHNGSTLCVRCKITAISVVNIHHNTQLQIFFSCDGNVYDLSEPLSTFSLYPGAHVLGGFLYAALRFHIKWDHTVLVLSFSVYFM